MSFDDVLRPVLAAPDARAVAFLDPQGQEVASLGDRGLLETFGAYHSVWTTELGRAAAAGGLGDVTEVDFDFEAGRVLATSVKDGYFVLTLFGRGGIPSIARPLLAVARERLAAEIG
ncbi:MAG: hypothetical protein IPN83_26105 [Holophagales bacterium]|nr:hypothetical protein [Holophagales bacterium]